ncbi:hypothetical protein GCM10027416_32420 [Okibacterium endophyticum]
MGRDVNIPMSDLERLNSSLKNIVNEFENAGSRGDELEAAIGNPHGEGALRDEVDRFEGAWNDRRDTLKEDVKSLQERVQDVAKAWADFDDEAAANLDQTETTPQIPERM